MLRSIVLLDQRFQPIEYRRYAGGETLCSARVLAYFQTSCFDQEDFQIRDQYLRGGEGARSLIPPAFARRLHRKPARHPALNGPMALRKHC